jgi:nesprin-1
VSRLTGKNECLKRWNALAGWSQAANDQLSHVLQQLEGQKPGAQELAHLLGEADEVQIQCEAQLSQYADLDQLTSSSGTIIKQGLSPKPCTVVSFVGQVEKQIGRVRDLVTDRTNQIRQLDEKWSQFEKEREGLLRQLQVIKSNADGLSASENNLNGIERFLPAISSLLDQTKRLETNKESLHKSGKYLTQLSSATLGSVQSKLSSVDNEFDAIQRKLLEQQNQCNDILGLWKECSDARGPIYNVISNAGQVRSDNHDRQPDDLNEAVQLSDQCRKSVEQLRKCRAPLDSLVIKSGHLHDRLDRLPGFDSRLLREEVAEMQQEWTDVQSALAGRIQTLDMQQVVLRQIANLKEEILNWTSDSKETLDEALSQPTDLDLMELKLKKVKQELPTYQGTRDSIRVKIEQLSELCQGHCPSSINSLQDLIDKEIDQVSCFFFF